MHAGLILLLLLGLAIAWAFMSAYTAWLLTHPPRRGYAFAVSRGLPGDPGECLGAGAKWTNWALRTSRGERDLPVWDVVGQDPSGPVVIVTHGWGDSRVVMLSRLPTLVQRASRVVLWDLPGHGDAPGSCALGASEADELARLVEVVGGENLVMYGYSLGAGVAIVAAARLGARVRGVIAEAPYRMPLTPARNMLALRGLPHMATLPPALAVVGLVNSGTPRWAWSSGASGFDRAEHASQLNSATRLLVIHGERDVICPVEDGQAIARAGRGELVTIAHGEHATIWRDPSQLAAASAAVDAFLASLAKSRA